jgi:hypothetical protein
MSAFFGVLSFSVGRFKWRLCTASAAMGVRLVGTCLSSAYPRALPLRCGYAKRDYTTLSLLFQI